MPEVPNATQAEDLDAVYDYLEEQVEEAMELMPWAAYDEIWNLKQNMMLSFTEFVRAEHENKKGRQPEVWKEVIPQFDQINYNMAELLNSYGKYGHIDSAEVRLEARQRVVDSIKQLDSFFKNAYQKLMGEDQDRTDDYDDSYMNSLVADAEELMPSEEFEEIDEPVRQMQESVQNFREAEKLEGPQPETWKAFQPQHQQIVENMEKMNASYQQQEPAEVKQEARQRTAASIQQADSFFKDAYQKLMEQDRTMQQEMAAMREQLEMMQQIMVNFSPDAMMKCMMAGADYLRGAEESRAAVKKEPTKAHRSFYQAARQSVHNVYQNIKEAPHRACEAFKQKAYAEADKGLRRIAGVFDKGIAALTERRNAILNLSPLAKQEAEAKQTEEVPKKQENQESQEKQEVKEPTKESPVKQEATKAISVQQLLNPETSERAVQALADSAMAAGYNAEAVGKAFTDLKIAAISSPQNILVEQIRADFELLTRQEASESYQNAVKMQNDMLPRAIETSAFRAGSIFSAYNRLSGDSINFWANDKKLYGYLADCEGHDLASYGQVGSTWLSLKKAMWSYQVGIHKELSDVMATVNQDYVTLYDRTTIVPSLAFCLDCQAGVLKYCPAGIPSLFIRRRGKADFESIPLQSPLLGYEMESRFQEQQLPLMNVDTIVFSSDGLSDLLLSEWQEAELPSSKHDDVSAIYIKILADVHDGHRVMKQ